MKAEHRKELETNILADRMGRLVQRMKTRPQKRAVLYVIGAIIVAAGLMVYLNARSNTALENSEHWRWIEDGYKSDLDTLIREYPETNGGKAARFQHAWLMSWDDGLLLLGAAPVLSFDFLDRGEKAYRILTEDCADDPVWGAEAMFARAVLEETRAIRAKDRDRHLDAARALYKQVSQKYPDSAHGKTAKKRLKLLDDTQEQKRVLGMTIAEFYADLESRLDVERNFADMEKLPQLQKK